MNIDSAIRNLGFWGFDLLRGRPIKNHLKNIDDILKDNKTSSRIKEHHLDALINHATYYTPFYKKYTGLKFEDFPIINKQIILENYNDFKSSLFKAKNLHKVSTSGSTGVPFHLLQNRNKRYRTNADVLYFSEIVGYTIGDTLYYLESWRHAKKNHSFLSRFKNLVYVDISKFEEKHIETFLNTLSQNKRNQNIIGLPSALESIYKYSKKNKIVLPDTVHIKSIITVSESLDNELKQNLESFFKTHVYSRYSNEEMGILAQQVPGSNDSFLINSASYNVEIMKLNSDEIASVGETGRLVITDLFNYSMPLLRYDTGDIGVLEVSDSQGILLKSIEGRQMDRLYDTSGNPVSPHLIHTLFFNYFDVLKQYQFIQESEKVYTVKLNTIGSFPHEEALSYAIKQDFGKDAIIEIVYVDEIPPLASGKRKKVHSNYIKS